MRKIVGEGAEAKLYLEKDFVIKDRISKKYRISELDEELRYARTRREVKILDKLSKAGLNVPRLIPLEKKNEISKDIDFKSVFLMSFVNGVKLRDYLSINNYEKICREIGKAIALMHNENIIHGDLTTSNMIYDEKAKDVSKKLFLLDFGLSFVSTRVEDKAVDLHLLKQALDSYHYNFCDVAFSIIVDEYLKKGDRAVLDRLNLVEKRGRNKH